MTKLDELKLEITKVDNELTNAEKKYSETELKKDLENVEFIEEKRRAIISNYKAIIFERSLPKIWSAIKSCEGLKVGEVGTSLETILTQIVQQLDSEYTVFFEDIISRSFLFFKHTDERLNIETLDIWNITDEQGKYRKILLKEIQIYEEYCEDYLGFINSQRELESVISSQITKTNKLISEYNKVTHKAPTVYGYIDKINLSLLKEMKWIYKNYKKFIKIH